MGRMVRKGFLQEMRRELCLAGCGGRTEGVTSVNVRSWEDTWCVQGWVSLGADRDAGKPQQHLCIWGLG